MKYKQLNNNIFDFFNDLPIKLVMVITFIWAFFESSVWFIFPDYILTIFVLAKPIQWKKILKACFIGSTIGMTFYFLLVTLNPGVTYEILIKIPFVQPEMIDFVSKLYEKNEFTILSQSLEAVPSKVWTYTAAVSGVGFLTYLILVSISRFIRMFFTSLLVSFLSKKFKRLVRNNFATIVMVYTIIFLAFLYYLEVFRW